MVTFSKSGGEILNNMEIIIIKSINAPFDVTSGGGFHVH